jgi:hypothetical protein
MLVVTVGGSEDDSAALASISADAGWSFRRVPEGGDTNGAAVIICDAACWREVIGSATAPVIVASNTANEQLWSDVLDMGGFDVLAKPFDRKEVVWSVELAHAHARARRPTAVPANR